MSDAAGPARMLSVAEAWQRIAAALGRAGGGSETVAGVSGGGAETVAGVSGDRADTVALDDALGRVLAEAVTAGRDLPPCDNSAMDGYAVRVADVPGRLPVTGSIAAGQPPGYQLAPGTTARIMTGAPVPAAADAVVIREDVEVDASGGQGEHAVFADAATPGQHIRRAGEDIAAGAIALEPGVRLGAGEIGLLAALGHVRVRVGRRPRVAILATGDELVPIDQVQLPDHRPGPGQIVNSSAHALAAQIREAGGVPVHCGIVPDDPDAITSRLRAILDPSGADGADGADGPDVPDVLVTSGGVSVGDHDHVADALAAAGVTAVFHKVAMKPGKPVVFGTSERGVAVFGLPGNPVSSMVSFELFVRPAILAMQGARNLARPRVPVTLAQPYGKQAGRAHYVRATLAVADGAGGPGLVATPLSRQGSGMLRSMVGVHALLEIAAERGDVPAGTVVTAIVIDWLDWLGWP